MSTRLLLVSPGERLGEVVHKMREHGPGCALVCDDEQLIGILTSRDLVRAFAARIHPSEGRVREWMTMEPIAVGADTPIDAGVMLMTEYGFHNLPVVEDGRPVGMVGLREAARRARRPAGIGLGF